MVEASQAKPQLRTTNDTASATGAIMSAAQIPVGKHLMVVDVAELTWRWAPSGSGTLRCMVVEAVGPPMRLLPASRRRW